MEMPENKLDVRETCKKCGQYLIPTVIDDTSGNEWREGTYESAEKKKAELIAALGGDGKRFHIVPLCPECEVGPGPTVSKTFSSNAGTMYDCPYAPGSACNQRTLMCGQQKYDIHCLLTIFRSITTGVHASHEYLRKDGMEHALLWLFDHGFIRPKHNNLSVRQVVDMIIKDEKYTKENIDR